MGWDGHPPLTVRLRFRYATEEHPSEIDGLRIHGRVLTRLRADFVPLIARKEEYGLIESPRHEPLDMAHDVHGLSETARNGNPAFVIEDSL
jgi:hypothetical protein